MKTRTGRGVFCRAAAAGGATLLFGATAFAEATGGDMSSGASTPATTPVPISAPAGKCVRGKELPLKGRASRTAVAARFELGLGDKLCLPWNVILRFEKVVSDSRCPADAMCVRQGSAKIAAIVRWTNRRYYRKGMVLGGTSATLRVPAGRVRFAALNPYPGTDDPEKPATPPKATFDVTMTCGRSCLRLEPKATPAPTPKPAPECVPAPDTACIALFDPVCAARPGGPLETYGNSCEAARECAVVKHKGECADDLPAPAECPRPIMCAEIYAPVCAKPRDDGEPRNFGNECEARRECATVVPKTECPAPPGVVEMK